MPGYSDPGFDTLSLHAGAQPDPATGASKAANELAPSSRVEKLRLAFNK